VDRSTHTGFIVDICATIGTSISPPEYACIGRVGRDIPFPVGGHRKKTVFLHVRREATWSTSFSKTFVASICFVFPDRNEFLPPGYCAVSDVSSGQPVNLHGCNKADRIIMCFRRSREGNPLVDVRLLYPHLGDTIPSGYTVIECTPSNQTAAIPLSNIVDPAKSSHTTTQLQSVFVAYKQRLSNLENLLPKPVHRVERTAVPSSFFATGATRFSSDNKHHDEVMKKSCSSTERTSPPLAYDSDCCDTLADAQRDLAESVFRQTQDTASMTEAEVFCSSFDALSRSSVKVNTAHMAYRSTLLLPVLTSCYTRHGGIAYSALNGLSGLLDSSSFFDYDIKELLQQNFNSSLLDLTLQVICDVAATFAEERLFRACLAFVDTALRKCKGNLTCRSIGFVVRLYAFVVHFGVQRQEIAEYKLTGEETASISTVDELGGDEPDWNVGLTLLSALGFKRLLMYLIENSLSESHNTGLDISDSATFINRSLRAIRRNGGNELFWQDITKICCSHVSKNEGKSMDALSVALAVLSFVAKMCSGAVTKKSEVFQSHKYSASLLYLDLMTYFLQSWNENNLCQWQASNEITACPVNRIVISTLIWNTEASRHSPSIFRRVLNIVSVLWRSRLARKTLRIELGMLMKNFFVGFMRPNLHETNVSLINKIELLKELSTWFVEHPMSCLDFFLNYDTDIGVDCAGEIPLFVSGSEWTILHQLNDSLLETIEACDHDSKHSTSAELTEALALLRAQAFATMATIVKSVIIGGGLVRGLDSFHTRASLEDSLKRPPQNDSEHRRQLVLSGMSVSNENNKKSDLGLNTIKDSQNIAFRIAEEATVVKAVEYLQSSKILTSSPSAVAAFLQIHKDRFSASKIGIYLSEGGNTEEEVKRLESTRYAYVRALSFVGMSLDGA